MQASDNVFGRPEDKDIQKEFMKRIRGDKLQTINAECELEICLAFKEVKKPKGKNRGRRQRESQQENTVKENEIQALQIGELDSNTRQFLTDQFSRLKQEWVFEELEEDKPLPDHFFDDGCDLSYILFNIQKDFPDRFKIFKAEELIFLELLCLQGRNHLTQSILEYYRSNMAYMVEAMKVGINKIKQKREAHRGNMLKGKERKASNEDHFSSFHETENNVADENESRSHKKDETKSKPIKKEKKGKKSKKNKEKDEESSSLDDEGASEQNQFPDDKELALKTCNYISWAYWYSIQK